MIPILTADLHGSQDRPDGPGAWRFSRWDGRFVFDSADKKRVGFYSDCWYDVDPFAAYVTRLEAENTRLSEQVRELTGALQGVLPSQR